MNARKREVLLIAQGLFIEKGFQNTSVQDILEAAHISKGTFYNYFTSKNECLIAILEKGSEVAEVRRHELVIGKDPKDTNVLASQIAVRLQVNREQNLVPILEAALHSGDPDLQKIIFNLHLKEIDWMAKRIVEIYGKDAKPYSYDCTILLFGMIQHMVRLWIGVKGEELNTEVITKFVIHHLEPILCTLQKNGETLLGPSIKQVIAKTQCANPLTSEVIVEKLHGFQLGLEEPNEYIAFFLEELQSAEPKKLIIESVLNAFSETFRNTSHEHEALELASAIWNWLKITADRTK